MEIKTRITIRSKTLGALMKDARLASNLSMKETAEALGISSSTYSSYEQGKKSPSLPELEAFAFFLNLPIMHFWGTEALSDDTHEIEKIDLPRLVLVRQRIIGALLRQERTKANVSIKALAKEVDIPQSRLKSYELGKREIPVPELEALLYVLDSRIEKFFDQNGPIGQWMKRQQAIEGFLDLPPELQDFVREPVNRPYLELARQLHELSADKLRSVAEGILDITF